MSIVKKVCEKIFPIQVDDNVFFFDMFDKRKKIRGKVTKSYGKDCFLIKTDLGNFIRFGFELKRDYSAIQQEDS